MRARLPGAVATPEPVRGRPVRDAGLVTLRKDGTKRFWRVDREVLAPVAEYLPGTWSSKLDTLTG